MIPKTMEPINIAYLRWMDMRGAGTMSTTEIAFRAMTLADALLAEVDALRAVASPSARVRHRAEQARAADAAWRARKRGAR